MANDSVSISEKTTVKVGRRTVGVIENGVFTKPVIGSKHMLRKPPAWAIDANAFDKQIKTIVTEIVVLDTELSKRYETPIAVFDAFKVKTDRGFGVQYYLPLNYWVVNDIQSDHSLN